MACCLLSGLCCSWFVVCRCRCLLFVDVVVVSWLLLLFVVVSLFCSVVLSCLIVVVVCCLSLVVLGCLLFDVIGYWRFCGSLLWLCFLLLVVVG